jgi:hypothetical protein
MLGGRCTRDPNARQEKRKHAAKLAIRTHSLTLAHFPSAYMFLGRDLMTRHKEFVFEKLRVKLVKPFSRRQGRPVRSIRKQDFAETRYKGSIGLRLVNITAFHRTYAHALQPITKPIVSVGQSVPGFVKGHGFSRAAKATQPSLRGASTAPSVFLFSPSTDDMRVCQE